jgi:hypothetical protein
MIKMNFHGSINGQVEAAERGVVEGELVATMTMQIRVIRGLARPATVERVRAMIGALLAAGTFVKNDRGDYCHRELSWELVSARTGQRNHGEWIDLAYEVKLAYAGRVDAEDPEAAADFVRELEFELQDFCENVMNVADNLMELGDAGLSSPGDMRRSVVVAR